MSGGDEVEAQRLLVAVGRAPVTGGLGLHAAGVRTDGTGHVITDRHLATTATGVYAAGDVTGRLQLTHAAYAMGRLAAHNAVGGRRKSRYDEHGTPRVVFTDPGIAQVGLTEAEARDADLDARVAELPMNELASTCRACDRPGAAAPGPTCGR